MKWHRNQIPMVRKCKHCEESFKKDSPPQIYCSMQCRLLDSIDKKDGNCWIWKKGKDKNGYGLMSVKDIPRRASRISYDTFIGYVPDDKFVCHSCDNPSCINPLHLFLGSPKDNTQNMFKKSRDRHIGEKNRNSVLNEKLIKEIFSLYRKGLSKTEISRIFNTSDTHICSIISRKIWKHVEVNE